MIVQAFWLGKIGTMERMCINSYLAKGVGFHLYTYGDALTDIENVPSRCDLRYAGDILPQEKIKLFPSPSIFSDFFRYALLMKNGGWYVDMDTICREQFSDALEYVFARDNIDQYYVSGCFMKAPKNSPIMVDCYEWIDKLTAEDRAQLGHMDIGPYLIQKAVPKFGLESYVAQPQTFDPIPWNKITEIVDPAKFDSLKVACSESSAIHLRQSIWNEGPNSCAGILPNGKKIMTDEKYPDNCLWELLKRKFA